jgi:hypothetical protein
MARMWNVANGVAVDVSDEKAARLSPRYWSDTEPDPAPEVAAGAAEADPSAAPDGTSKPSEDAGATDTPVKPRRPRGRPTGARKAT